MLDQLSNNIRNVFEVIRSEGRSDVTTMSKQLNLSESTVRRALLVLEQNRYIRRYRGGASLVQTPNREASVFKRIPDRSNQKIAIARAAAAHIIEGDRIIMTGGSTIASMCRFIKDIRDLTIITDSLLVINELMNSKELNLISLGGVLNINEQCFEGHIATSNMKLFRTSKMFQGIKGITAKDGFLTDDIRQIDFYRQCSSYCDQLIIVADSSKFHQEGITQMFAPSEVDLLITDDNAPQNIIHELEQQNCTVEIVNT